jgi:hypothetical protein
LTAAAVLNSINAYFHDFKKRYPAWLTSGFLVEVEKVTDEKWKIGKRDYPEGFCSQD